MTRALYTVSNGDHKADSTLYCEQKRPERRKQNETAHFGISSIAETGNLDGENVLCAVLEYFRNMQKANTTYLAVYTRVYDVLRVILGYERCQLFCLFMYSVN